MRSLTGSAAALPVGAIPTTAMTDTTIIRPARTACPALGSDRCTPKRSFEAAPPVASAAAMAAQIIDGKAVAARVRAEVAEDVAAFTAQHGTPPGSRRSSSATTRRRRSTSAASRRRRAEVGIARLRPPPAGRRHARARSPPSSQQLNADPAVSGILCQLPVPDHLDGVELTGLIDARQGRRRADAGQRRPARARPRGAAAVHAAGRDDAARGGRRRSSRAPRPSSSGARTCSASRWRSCCSAPTRR